MNFPKKWNPLLQGGNRSGCDVAQIASSAITVLALYSDRDYGHLPIDSDGSQGAPRAFDVANNNHKTAQ
jgi:hypothetical protein